MGVGKHFKLNWRHSYKWKIFHFSLLFFSRKIFVTAGALRRPVLRFCMTRRQQGISHSTGFCCRCEAVKARSNKLKVAGEKFSKWFFPHHWRALDFCRPKPYFLGTFLAVRFPRAQTSAPHSLQLHLDLKKERLNKKWKKKGERRGIIEIKRGGKEGEAHAVKCKDKKSLWEWPVSAERQKKLY